MIAMQHPSIGTVFGGRLFKRRHLTKSTYVRRTEHRRLVKVWSRIAVRNERDDLHVSVAVLHRVIDDDRRLQLSIRAVAWP